MPEPSDWALFNRFADRVKVLAFDCLQHSFDEEASPILPMWILKSVVTSAISLSPQFAVTKFELQF